MKSIKGLRVLASCEPAKLSRMRIGAGWETGTSDEFLEVVSPSTGEVVGCVPMGTREDARRAIAAAQAAKESIAGLSVWDRARLCMKVADAIEARREELARVLCLEQGKPYHAEALGEVSAAASGFRNAGEQIKWLETACFPVEDRNKRAFSFLQPKGVFAVIEMCPYWEMHIPAGGAAGTSSGLGRTGGRHTLLEMSDLKTVTIDISR